MSFSNQLSIVIAAHNDEEIIVKTLRSVEWANELIVVLSEDSTDGTLAIVKEYTRHIFRSQNNLGVQRNLGILKSTNRWILILDTDEVVSPVLKEEIINKIKNSKFHGYTIPFRNYFLKHPVFWGNQNYKKRRLFDKKFGYVEKLQVHPEVVIQEPIGTLDSHIYHHSFRTISQTLKKFTYYAKSEAPVLFEKGERTNLKKLTMYPAHMFWAIFIKDEGWKDSIWGFGLALCFTYYEFARYYFLLLETISKRKNSI